MLGMTERRTLQEIRGILSIGETKKARGVRRVDISAATVAVLREHHKKLLAEGHPGPWVFCDTEGGPVRKYNLVRRSFRPILEKAKLEIIRFHDRHSRASILLAAGVHPKIVQERLGHASIALTLDTYSHLIPTLQKDAAEKLDDI